MLSYDWASKGLDKPEAEDPGESGFDWPTEYVSVDDVLEGRRLASKLLKDISTRMA